MHPFLYSYQSQHLYIQNRATIVWTMKPHSKFNMID